MMLKRYTDMLSMDGSKPYLTIFSIKSQYTFSFKMVVHS